MSPKIINVAVPEFQHSPILGHLASSQTVWSFSCLSKLASFIKEGPPGMGTLNHFGNRPGDGPVSRVEGVMSIMISDNLLHCLFVILGRLMEMRLI